MMKPLYVYNYIFEYIYLHPSIDYRSDLLRHLVLVVYSARIRFFFGHTIFHALCVHKAREISCGQW